jgi:hypothetical protein
MTRRRHLVLLRGWLWNALRVRVVILGPDRYEFLVHRAFAPSEWPHYDFEDDVRELICEPVHFNTVAMWSDPRERLFG